MQCISIKHSVRLLECTQQEGESVREDSIDTRLQLLMGLALQGLQGVCENAGCLHPKPQLGAGHGGDVAEVSLSRPGAGASKELFAFQSLCCIDLPDAAQKRQPQKISKISHPGCQNISIPNPNPYRNMHPTAGRHFCAAVAICIDDGAAPAVFWVFSGEHDPACSWHGHRHGQACLARKVTFSTRLISQWLIGLARLNIRSETVCSERVVAGQAQIVCATRARSVLGDNAKSRI